jgi:hypothetical protein
VRWSTTWSIGLVCDLQSTASVLESQTKTNQKHTSCFDLFLLLCLAKKRKDRARPIGRPTIAYMIVLQNPGLKKRIAANVNKANITTNASRNLREWMKYFGSVLGGGGFFGGASGFFASPSLPGLELLSPGGTDCPGDPADGFELIFEPFVLLSWGWITFVLLSWGWTETCLSQRAPRTYNRSHRESRRKQNAPDLQQTSQATRSS